MSGATDPPRRPLHLMSGARPTFSTPRPAREVRRRETVVGYWVVLDSPTSTERVARIGYDYVCLDGQHGLFGYSGMLTGLTAIDAAGQAVGIVRVAGNDVA